MGDQRPLSAPWGYPCLCLCFGFVQITRTTPSRWTILHLSHIFLTDALTFIKSFPVPHGLVNTQGPFAVIATVCSKCAEYLPSSVTAVQRSAFTRLPGFPALTIGSIASTIPSFNRGFSLRRST